MVSKPTFGQPAEPEREDDLAHQGDPEQRHRIEEQRAGRDRGIRPFARAARGENAEDRCRARARRRRRRREQQRRRQALGDQLDHRAALAIGEAEIEGEDIGEVDPELLVERPVEAELLAKLAQEFGIRRTRLARHDGSRIARSERGSGRS
jgi:hypothetical protein